MNWVYRKVEFKNKKGFTLLELLIVIAIIGILASVVLVKLTGGREKAKRSKVLTTMNSVAKIADSCIIGGGSLVVPIYDANPGTAICMGGTEILPDLTGTDFRYCGSPGCGGWTSNTAGVSYAISATTDSPRKIVVCGFNTNVNGWFGLNIWDFFGTSGCKTSGF